MPRKGSTLQPENEMNDYIEQFRKMLDRRDDAQKNPVKPE